MNRELILTQQLTYDQKSNITKIVQDDSAYDFEYDELDQLTAAKRFTATEIFFYDKAGNHLFNPDKPAKYSPTNAIISDPSQQTTYEYDKLGRMIRLREAEKTTELAWNSRSQLKKATVDGKEVTYFHDPFGRRVGKVFSDGTSEFYGYKGEDIAAVYGGSLQLKHTYLHGPEIDEPLLARDRDKKNIFIADYLGSIRQVTDDRGQVLAEYDYGVFGLRKIVRRMADELISSTYAYTGREWDQETGWYYLRNRSYSSSDYRFLTRDPVRYEGGINLYHYVGNAPLYWVDPWGLDKIHFYTSSGLVIWLDDYGKTKKTYYGTSGPFGKGSLPTGQYKGSNFRRRSDKTGMICPGSQTGWSINLDPLNFSTDRTELRIHPDGNKPGTLGCIGIECSNSDVDDFGFRAEEYFLFHATIDVEVFR